MTIIKRLNLHGLLVMAFSLLMLSCGSDDEQAVNPLPDNSDVIKITVDPSITYQEMVGFGGALTWYSDLILSSSKKNEITNLIFNDLGSDIFRFKNCYYPDNYPATTSTSSMSDDNSKLLWDVTNQLQQLAKAQNPDVKILLSSWGPPAGLKDNSSSRQGTLKKDGGTFMYDAYATYWENLLNNLPFSPEYISIQNEPSFINPGWTTCEWSATETSTLPGYNIAVDKVYEKIQARTNKPIIVGPESPNTTSFASFAEALKDKPHVEMYAYHPYDINSATSASQTKSSLQSIRTYNNKPNLMTEYSDNLSWFNTAVFINSTLTNANSSGYIYWKMVWAQPAGGEDAAMISINSSGNYTITPFYYVMKHFSKNINTGYIRVKASSGNPDLDISAFISTSKNEVTVVVINTGPKSVDIKFEVTGETVRDMNAVQSKDDEFYRRIEITEAKISIEPKTVSTIVLEL